LEKVGQSISALQFRFLGDKGAEVLISYVSLMGLAQLGSSAEQK